jgi:phosphoserine phosphatase
VEKIVKKLKEKHITTAIATDSYQFLADDLRARLDFEYAFGNHLILNHHLITGDIHLNNSKRKSCLDGRIYSICKEHILEDLCTKLDINIEEAIAIGDGIVDIGMIQKAGLGIAFHAPEKVQKSADVVTNDLNILLAYI